MDAKPDLSLPAVPPPPAGERIESRARGLAGLIAAQDSAVIHHRSERLTAMVIVVNGRVVDAVAQTQSEVIKGVDVLDELGDLPMSELAVIGVEPRLARVLSVYWRAPGATQEVVDALRRPGRRGAVLASSPTHGTGIVVFDERGIVASFLDGEARDDAIEAVLRDPNAIISPRAEPIAGAKPIDLHPSADDELEPEAVATPQPEPIAATTLEATAGPVTTFGAAAQPEHAAGPEPHAGPPTEAPPSQPAPFGGPGPFGGPAPIAEPDYRQAGAFPTPPPVSPPAGNVWGSAPAYEPAPSPSYQAQGQPPPDAGTDPALGQRRQAIVDLLERELGRHADTVSEPFRTAPSVEALIGAAQALATVNVRLISPARMQNLSQQASAIARGEQAPA